MFWLPPLRTCQCSIASFLSVKNVNPNIQSKQNQNCDEISRRLAFSHFFFLNRNGQVYLQQRMAHCRACRKDIDVAQMGETESAL